MLRNRAGWNTELSGRTALSASSGVANENANDAVVSIMPVAIG